MPAHLIALTDPTRVRPKCPSCSKRALVRLRNTWNASNGVFCRACGKRALKKQLANEDAAYARAIADEGKAVLESIFDASRRAAASMTRRALRDLDEDT